MIKMKGLSDLLWLSGMLTFYLVHHFLTLFLVLLSRRFSHLLFPTLLFFLKYSISCRYLANRTRRRRGHRPAPSPQNVSILVCSKTRIIQLTRCLSFSGIFSVADSSRITGNAKARGLLPSTLSRTHEGNNVIADHGGIQDAIRR